MIWPKATSEDRARMMRWAELREAPRAKAEVERNQDIQEPSFEIYTQVYIYAKICLLPV